MAIDWPIAVDNDYAVWNAFANHYWPACTSSTPKAVPGAGLNRSYDVVEARSCPVIASFGRPSI
jgi:hypothetical protein